jgi:MFS family permease
VIYFPVWIDQFGPTKSKTILMTFLQVGVPLGIVIGYGIVSFIKNNIGWQYGFVAQGAICMISLIICLFIPNVYFSHTKKKLIEKSKQTNIDQNEKSKSRIKFKTSMDTTYLDETEDKESTVKILCKKFSKLFHYKVNFVDLILDFYSL